MKRISNHQNQLYNQVNHDDAYYPEVLVQTQSHGTYNLEGRLLAQNPDTPPNIIVIHGARADFTKGDDIVLPLHEKGLSILSATTSGHGAAGLQSDIPFSLDDNLTEAIAFSNLLQDTNRVAIGFSMGGTTAVRLVAQNPEKYSKLILFYPTAFPDTAYPIPFGTKQFGDIASEKGTFLNSSFFDVIKQFSGKIMLIKGEYDGLDPKAFDRPQANTVQTVTIEGREIYSPIPPEVFSKILQLRPDTRYVVLPGADHRFSKWFESHPKDANFIADQLFDFITAAD